MAGHTSQLKLRVTSLDRSPIHNINVTITGSNDSASITVSSTEDNAVTEAGGLSNATSNDPFASGQHRVLDYFPTRRSSDLVAPASLLGIYGSFTFNATTGVWGYTLNQSLADP